MKRPAFLAAVAALAAFAPALADARAPFEAPAHWSVQATRAESMRTDWWRLLGDPRLDQLVDVALIHNRDLKAARANVAAARALAGEATARLLPTGDIEASRSRVRQSAAADPFGQSLDAPLPTQSLRDYGASLRWEIDLFGGLRAGAAVARADVNAAAWERRRVEAGVAAQVVRAYVDLLAAKGLASRARARIAALEGIVARLEKARDLGALPADRVYDARATLESFRADLPRVEFAARSAARRLATLTGHPPGHGVEIVALAGVEPLQPPVDLAVVDPAWALRQRPDVAIAEARLAAASARVKIETAALYPRITLLGVGGRTAPGGALESAPAVRFAYGPQLTWGIFDIAATRARIKAAGASADAALAAWEGATLQALEEADGAIDAYTTSRESLASAELAFAAATQGAEAVSARFAVGQASALDVARARAVELAVEAAAYDARASVTRAWIEANLALGAGWRDRDPARGT